jgi:hypothetical protein
VVVVEGDIGGYASSFPVRPAFGSALGTRIELNSIQYHSLTWIQDQAENHQGRSTAWPSRRIDLLAAGMSHSE